MPHKFNASRRHKFDKAQYRVINWAEYNESLRQRGDLTIWVSGEAQSVWSAPRRTSRGGQWRYSDLAIETCHRHPFFLVGFLIPVVCEPRGGAEL